MSASEALGPPTLVEPVFTVLGVEADERAVAPTLRFILACEEPSGRPVHTIALTAQIQLEPALRRYDDEARSKLVGLFGPPERWKATTQPMILAQATAHVPSFVGATTFVVPVACTFDLELAATKYLYSIPDGHAPLSMHFNGTIFYEADDGRLQMALVPWSSTADFRLPVAVWKDLMRRHYPEGGWVALHPETLDALRAEQVRRGAPTLDACLGSLLRGEEC